MPERTILKIVPRPMRRQVEDGLRKAIASGAFPPGAHLPDRMLSEAFGASRSVVREAVRLLEAEGLVVVHPHRGAFVATISVAEARQIYELRTALEGLAGEGFALRASDAERATLLQIHEELAASGPETPRETLLDIKRRFYETLTLGCGNVYVARSLAQLLNRNSQLRAASFAAPGRLPLTVAEIGRIVEAVDRRDAKAAGEACREHVREAEAAALLVLAARDRRAASAG
ncbi:MAG TPA: GntR family transcriptional regulator [Acidiphilium sp.]